MTTQAGFREHGQRSLKRSITTQPPFSTRQWVFRRLYNNTTGLQQYGQRLSGASLNTTGNSNTATGVEALFSNTTGSGNIALGFQPV